MARQAILEIIADASKLKPQLEAAEGSANKFGAGVGKALAVIGGTAAITKFGMDSVKAFTESEQAQSKLELALRNSTATVGVHADEFAKLNTQLAKHTLVDDDVIAATEAQMVTFGASKDQIQSMIPTVLDFAAKMGIDAPEAADLFDKASLGSAKALKTLGIEGYKPTGDKANDLANIQGLLAGKVKGAAQAQLDAASPGAVLKKHMDELQESVGKLLVPALKAAAEILSKVVDWFTNVSAPVKIAIGVAGGLAVAVWALNAAQTAWTAITGALAVAQGVLNAVMDANPIVLVIAAIAGLIAGLVLAYQHCEAFRKIVDAVFGWIAGFVSGAFDTIKNVIGGVFDWVKNNWPLLLAILTGPIGLAVLAIMDNWDTIKNAFTAVKNWIGDRIGDVVGFITGIPGRIAGVASTMWDGIKNAFTAVKNWISDRIGDVVGFFTGMPGRITSAVAGLFDGIKAAFIAPLKWIQDKWNDLSFTIGGGELPFPPHTKFPSLTLDTPDIHVFKEGGLVTGPTLGLIGEAGPEMVLPLGRIPSGGSTYQISVTAIDPASAATAVVNAIQEYESRNGSGWRA